MMRRSSLLDRKLNTSRALRWPAELTGQGFVFARRDKVNNTYVKYYWLLFKDNSCETLTAVNILCKHVVEKLPSPNPESVTCDGENKRKPSYMSNTHREIPMENFFFFQLNRQNSIPDTFQRKWDNRKSWRERVSEVRWTSEKAEILFDGFRWNPFVGWNPTESIEIHWSPSVSIGITGTVSLKNFCPT